MYNQQIVIAQKLRDILLEGIDNYRLVFLSAGAGWGKTAAAKTILAQRRYRYFDLSSNRLPDSFPKDALVVLDNFHAAALNDERRFQAILRKESSGQHFLILSRSPSPGYLTVYEGSGSMLRLNASDLRLDTASLAQLLKGYGLSLPACDLQRLGETSLGHPVAAKFIVWALAEGRKFDLQTIEEVREKMGDFYEEKVFRHLEASHRKLLLSISFFDEADLTLIKLLTGASEAKDTLLDLKKAGVLIEKGGTWNLADGPLYIQHLRKTALIDYSPEMICMIHRIGGHWYAQKGEFAEALLHYHLAGSHRDILQTLMRNFWGYPNDDVYYMAQEYCACLEFDVIQASPELMCGMSMLCSLTGKLEASEKWYISLHDFTSRKEGDNAQRGTEYLTFLELCLPQRDAGCLLEAVPFVEKGMALPTISFTGKQPSILRGSKDLSKLMLQGKTAFEMLQRLETAVGSTAVGLSGIVNIENRLERGEDVSGQLFSLMLLQRGIQRNGNLAMEFALVAILIRTVCAAGNVGKAKDMLAAFRKEAEKSDAKYLFPDIDAMHCRISLLRSDNFADTWFANLAPDECRFSVHGYYRYLTKVRCYVQRKEYHSALILLGWIMGYLKQYHRILDTIEALLLISICRYRMDGDDWQTYLSQALQAGFTFGYVAVFTREGIALLPLLEQYDKSQVDRDYWNQLYCGTTTQAAYYSAYLKPLSELDEILTQTERTVLRLICQGKSNENICETLQIKMPTVKTHTYNLFKKLNVSSRIEAQQLARRFYLV